MSGMEKYLEKIGNELDRLNNNIERSIEIAEKMTKPVEEIKLTSIEQAKEWFENVLNEVLIDIGMEFSKEVSGIDRESIEYEEKLLKALKRIRAVMRIKEMVDEFFTEEGIDKAIEKLEKHIEYKRKASVEKTKEAFEAIAKGKPVSEEVSEE